MYVTIAPGRWNNTYPWTSLIDVWDSTLNQKANNVDSAWGTTNNTRDCPLVSRACTCTYIHLYTYGNTHIHVHTYTNYTIIKKIHCPVISLTTHNFRTLWKVCSCTMMLITNRPSLQILLKSLFLSLSMVQPRITAWQLIIVVLWVCPAWYGSTWPRLLPYCALRSPGHWPCTLFSFSALPFFVLGGILVPFCHEDLSWSWWGGWLSFLKHPSGAG